MCSSDLSKRNTVHSDRERKREEAQRRQERYKLLKPLRNKIDRVEKDIATLEEDQAGIERDLGLEDTYKDENKVKALNQRYREVKSQLEDRYREWETLQAEAERLQQEFDTAEEE